MEKLSGTIEHIIYHNDDNGYTVFSISAQGKEITCVGFFADLQEGVLLDAEGQYTEHPAYGRQFKITSFVQREPESRDAIERYLASGAVKGIGAVLASRIVKRFGGESLRILEEEPERLEEIKGISARKAREIGVYFAEQAGLRRAMIFLQQYGVTLKTGIRIYRQYGEDMYSILKENPYRLAEDVNGIGFLTADRIAREIGIRPDSEYRIRSAFLYVLSEAMGEGSVYLPEEILIRRTSSLLEVDPESVVASLQGMVLEHNVIRKERRTLDETETVVYMSSCYYTELNAARMLLDLAGPTGDDETEILKKLERIQESSGITLAKEQIRAVAAAAGNGVTILTGGPGTGKTTAINEMIRYFRKERMTFFLAAPTGRAAKRMTETTGYEASTIHRLLMVSTPAEDGPGTVYFDRNRENPLEADAVIIDEMSMVDIFLFHALLDAITPGTRLVLVGDVDQLPSVGPGAVLRDIIGSGAFTTIRLTEIFRQAAESDIVVNAHRINRGLAPEFRKESKDFFLLKRDDPNRIISNTIELIRDRLPSYVKARPLDIQVLCPMRKGPLGVERLNSILQRYLNPEDPGKMEKTHGDRTFREGDKVMQIRNNYQLEWEIPGRYNIPVDSGSGIYNGDMGIIRKIDSDGTFLVEFDEGRIVDYPQSELEDLELAYAVTIHKSQGSEYPAVILPILSGPPMLMTRNLLYTAVTRARSCAVILGSQQAVEQMVSNISEQRRYTSLDERIRELAWSDE